MKMQTRVIAALAIVMATGLACLAEDQNTAAEADAKRQTMQILADKIQHNAETKEIAASGNVVFTIRDGSTVKGEKVVIKTDANATVVSGGAKNAGGPDAVRKTVAAALIRNGADWKDTDGNPVSCHEGGMSRFGDTFYWYGTSYIGNPKGICGKRQQEQGLQRGLNVYSSQDLVNWKYEGVCLDYTRPGNALEGSGHRPGVIYNDKTKKYVMWFFDIVKYPGVMMKVAVADSPTGPFSILGARRTGEEHGYAQDCALFKDDDGKAYLAYDDGFRNLRVDLLSEDYLSSTGKSVIALPKAPSPDKDRGHEGTAFAKYKGKYIIAGSGVRGWHGTPTHYAVADSPLGPYSEKDCMSNDNTWGSQISNFIHIKETDTLMAVCDQWARIHGPDCKLCASWPGDDTTVKELEASRYLWLPVAFVPKTGKARMQYLEEWDPLHPAKK